MASTATMTGSHLTDERLDSSVIGASITRSSDGALVLFEGIVRDHHEGKRVESIHYEAYRPMAEKEIDRILTDLHARHPGVRLAVRHRLGRLHVGDVSIVIACSSPHRAEAFAACREAIDRIKQTVPIWKKERSPEGEEWVGWQGQEP